MEQLIFHLEKYQKFEKVVDKNPFFLEKKNKL